MVQPNYGFAKRQRELAKKQAKEEKAKRKAANPDAPPELDDPSDTQGDAGNAPPAEPQQA
jgi:hypothetical protein